MLLLTNIDNAAEKRLISCICCKIGENDFVNLLWNIFQALYDKLLEKMINLRQTPQDKHHATLLPFFLLPYLFCSFPWTILNLETKK